MVHFQAHRPLMESGPGSAAEPASSSDTTLVWGFAAKTTALKASDRAYLARVPTKRPDVEWLWSEMNRVWQTLGLSNRSPLAVQDIGSYYAHPVWLLNGIFTATDPESIRHRAAIAHFVERTRPTRVADYGGGFGELGRAIARKAARAHVEVVEPYPSQLARELIAEYPNASFVDALSDRYDAVIAQDVLEHVEDPVGVALMLARAVSPGGLLLFANCFYPVIDCHLPRTFFLRHTFVYVMRGLGLGFVGTVPDAEHVQVFRVGQELGLVRYRWRALVARALGPLANSMARPYATALHYLRLR